MSNNNNYALATKALNTVKKIQQIPYASRLPKYTQAAIAEAFDMDESQEDNQRAFRQIIWRHRKGSKKYNIPRLNNIEIAYMAQDWYTALYSTKIV